MNSKKKTLGLWAIVAISILFLFTVLVLIISQPGANISAAYHGLYQEYANLHQEYLLIDSQLTQSNPEYTSKSLTLPTEQTEFGTSLLAPYFLLALLGLGAIVIIGILNNQFEQQAQQLKDDFEIDANRKYGQGRKDTLISIANELVSDKDIMTDLATWLMEYDSGVAKIDKAAYVHRQILDRLMRQIRLFPLSQVWQEIEYDPKQHINYDNLKPGEKAIVVEPGWRVGTEIIKAAVVRRK